MSVTELENPLLFQQMDPHALFNHVNKAYEEFKHLYQEYTPSQDANYKELYQKMGKLYQNTFRAEDSDPVTLKLHQELAQFRLELELSDYI